MYERTCSAASLTTSNDHVVIEHISCKVLFHHGPSITSAVIHVGSVGLLWHGVSLVCLHRYVRPGQGFVPNFQLFEKGDVNGADEQSAFTFLKVTTPRARGLTRLTFHRSSDPVSSEEAQSLQSYKGRCCRWLVI